MGYRTRLCHGQKPAAAEVTGNTAEIASPHSNVKVIVKPLTRVSHIPPQTTAGDAADASLSVYETAIIFNIPVRGSI